MRVTVYLSTPLFSFGGASSPVPEGCMALEGEQIERQNGAVTVQVKRFLDSRGRMLMGVPRLLIVPLGKVDHILVQET